MLVLASCSNQEDLSSQKPPIEKKSNFETFAIYGEVHNAMLKEADANFVAPTEIASSKNEAIEHVLEFQKKNVETLSIPSKDKEYLLKGMEEHKNLYCTEDLMSQFTKRNSRASEEFNDSEEDITTDDIKSLINNAYSLGEIDSFEHKTFMQLVDCVVDNASGKLSNSAFDNEVCKLINQWEIKYSDVDFSQLEVVQDDSELPPLSFDLAPKGALGGVVLNVSKSSLEYWDATTPKTRAVPAFVGADIAGAVVGACSGAIGSYAVSRKVNWKGVAWSATSGAITGSTGIVGKIGKWISKML